MLISFIFPPKEVVTTTLQVPGTTQVITQHDPYSNSYYYLQNPVNGAQAAASNQPPPYKADNYPFASQPEPAGWKK